jgi:hypothetical protein
MPDTLETPAKFFAYLWTRPDGTPYYAGQGTRKRAMYTHRRKIQVPSDRSRIFLFPRASKDEAVRTEMELIANWGRIDIGTGCLLNKSNGGYGGGFGNSCARGKHTFSDEGRANVVRMLRARAGIKHGPHNVSARGREGMAKNAGSGIALHVRWHVSQGISSSSCRLCKGANVNA